MQREDQWDDTGANKYHTETSFVWLKLIPTNGKQMKFTQPLSASTCMLALVMAFGRSQFQVLRLAFEQSSNTFKDCSQRRFFQREISSGSARVVV